MTQGFWFAFPQPYANGTQNSTTNAIDPTDDRSESCTIKKKMRIRGMKLSQLKSFFLQKLWELGCRNRKLLIFEQELK